MLKDLLIARWSDMGAYQETVEYYQGSFDPDDIIRNISEMAENGYEVTNMTSHNGVLYVVYKKYYPEEE